jgi:hypothetical protein
VDILLNSAPSSANSSRPLVVTRVEKSPDAMRRAAARKEPIWACSERDTATANVIASTRKPSRMPAASRRLREMASWRRASSLRRAIRTSRSSKPVAVKVTAR